MSTKPTAFTKALEPPQVSRVFVGTRGQIVVTDLWKKWKARPVTSRLMAEAGTSIGVNDFGILRGEEPPIDRGVGTGAVYIHGCPLRCQTCYQPEFFADKARIRMSEESLADLFLELEAQGAASLSIVMATLQKPVLNALQKARSRSLKLDAVLNYSGWLSKEALESLGDSFQIYLPDLKAMSSIYRREHGLPESYSTAAKEGIRYLARSKRSLILRHLILPQLPDPLIDFRMILQWMKEEGISFPLSVLTEFFCPKEKRLVSLSQTLKDEVFDLCQKENLTVYIQGKASYDYSL